MLLFVNRSEIWCNVNTLIYLTLLIKFLSLLSNRVIVEKNAVFKELVVKLPRIQVKFKIGNLVSILNLE